MEVDIWSTFLASRKKKKTYKSRGTALQSPKQVSASHSQEAVFPDFNNMDSGGLAVCGDLTKQETLVPPIGTIQYSSNHYGHCPFERSLLPHLRFKATQMCNITVVLLWHFSRRIMGSSWHFKALSCISRTSHMPRWLTQRW